ncbi:hypothetical protein AGLY_004164, partial [Aphis glycines]
MLYYTKSFFKKSKIRYNTPHFHIVITYIIINNYKLLNSKQLCRVELLSLKTKKVVTIQFSNYQDISHQLKEVTCLLNQSSIWLPDFDIPKLGHHMTFFLFFDLIPNTKMYINYFLYKYLSSYTKINFKDHQSDNLNDRPGYVVKLGLFRPKQEKWQAYPYIIAKAFKFRGLTVEFHLK